MKIAIISDHIPSQWSHSMNTMKHSEGFFRLGNKVEILAIERLEEKLKLLKIKDIYNFYDINPQIKIKYFRDNTFQYFKGVKSTLLKNYSYFLDSILRKFLHNVYDVLDPELKIGNYCKKNKINLAYCRSTYKTAIYNIFNKVPTILESHNFVIINHYLKILLKLSQNKYFKGIITISRGSKEVFKKNGVPEEKILVIEDSVDLSKFDSILEDKKILRKQLNLPLNKNIILHLGSLFEGRGIETILKMTKNFENNNFSFYFIGGQENVIKKWKKYISKKKINADINFLGFKDNAQVPLYLKSADILITAYSKQCSTARVMSPLTVFEYMASKTPFIASNLKRLKEICNNNECLFFKADDPRDLSEKIKILIENHELQKALTLNAHNKVKNYTYIKRCKEIINFINLNY